MFSESLISLGYSAPAALSDNVGKSLGAGWNMSAFESAIYTIQQVNAAAEQVGKFAKAVEQLFQRVPLSELAHTRPKEWQGKTFITVGGGILLATVTKGGASYEALKRWPRPRST